MEILVGTSSMSTALIIIYRQAPTVYVDPVLVGQLSLEEQLGLLSFTVSLSIYWQVSEYSNLLYFLLVKLQDFRLVIRPDLNKSSWQHVSFWASKELWLPEVGVKCLINVCPCF